LFIVLSGRRDGVRTPDAKHKGFDLRRLVKRDDASAIRRPKSKQAG